MESLLATPYKSQGRKSSSLFARAIISHKQNGIRSSRPYTLRHVRGRRRAMLMFSLLAAGTASSRLTYNSSELEGATKILAYSSSLPSLADSDPLRFDADSFEIKIDNCSTRSMSGIKTDFLQESLVPIKNTVVESYGGGTTPITHKGTIKWKISDDDGVKHDILIANSFYVPGISTRLLSPQHMSQQAKDNYPKKDGTWCATYADCIKLQWDQRKYTRTIPITNDNSNVGSFWSSAGYDKYKAYCTVIGDLDDTNKVYSMSAATRIEFQESK